MGSLPSWKKYLDLAYPTKPADWDIELARIDAKLSEPGRMKALQAMCKSKPDRCRRAIGERPLPGPGHRGQSDPDWADPRAEGENIIADLPTGSR